MGGRHAATVIIAVLAGLCLGPIARTVCFTERILTDSSESSRTPLTFRPSTAAAVQLAIEMDAQGQQEEMWRRFATKLLVIYSVGLGPAPLLLEADHDDTHAVFARDISDFGWSRTLGRVPGVVVR